MNKFLPHRAELVGSGYSVGLLALKIMSIVISFVVIVLSLMKMPRITAFSFIALLGIFTVMNIILIYKLLFEKLTFRIGLSMKKRIGADINDSNITKAVKAFLDPTYRVELWSVILLNITTIIFSIFREVAKKVWQWHEDEMSNTIYQPTIVILLSSFYLLLF